MNYILIANTATWTVDYYTLGVTLITLIVIIAGIRRIIRGGRPRKKEMIANG